MQNIGAYGRELSEFVIAVHGADLERRSVETLSAEACEFAYRESVFKGRLRDRFVITAVDLKLPKTPAMSAEYPALAARLKETAGELTPRKIMDTVIALRRERLPDPARIANAGSFFKNPVVASTKARQIRAAVEDAPLYPQADGRVKLSAAWLIERCGLRGYSPNAAAISDRHALVVVNRGGATQKDILALAAEVQEAVAGRFGVDLEIEPRVYGGE